ncbi:myoD family inhibitor domain-containing protein isoform X2 [Lates calcarifer]|uniref:MyoD family inhibitor domain-containing protein isoform X2 n=1 Tax=Lates calcarifer TaxID=8187 RepID=A0A4W6EJ39_LATCA|nr:myoD family inhibitor domain-containing protein isoform X2 [Lates calcarifer]XP_018542995.1 myoD family inhibitor domain-containing protein isoform X2 [Lates calcarifer]
MEVTSHCNGSDITESRANKNPNQSDCLSSQPTANGTLPQHNTEEAPPPVSSRSEDGDISDDSLTGTSSTNDVSQLLPSQPTSALRKQKGVDSLSVSPSPVCTPPSSSTSPPPRTRPRSSTCNRHSCSLPHHHHSTKRLSSTKSHASFKTDAAHIKEVAGDDCCVHCLLACLFCEMLSMCSAVGECLACVVGGAGCCDAAVGCCCCVEAAGEAACTEEACQAVLDCGILEDCCGSSDCLEICLECCSICFPA